MTIEDPMPIFTIVAKDKLAPLAVEEYAVLCRRWGLPEQEAQVQLALDEILQWQRDHFEQVKMPDHDHVPVERGAVVRDPSDLWQAVLCDAYGQVIDVEAAATADDPVLWVVRRSALPFPAGATVQRMPCNGSYDEADVAHRQAGFLAHRQTIPVRFAEAQAMAAGLNAAEATR